ncbi:MAG: hypothetical protein MOGMAGMI_00130 [Candidatus Omnitrophica bacterium]|nr:hypothetical protein [Candidatus Omnitrophota bacterium]
MTFEKGAVRRSLYYSILDGLFTAMMLGVEAYFVAYAIALGASTSLVAFLSTFPLLVSVIVQIRSASVTQRIGSRMGLIRRVVFFHVLAWVPIITLPYTARALGRESWMPYLLAGALTLYHCLAAFGVPAWQSLISDYVPVLKRGRYFGWRNRLQGIVMVTVSVLAGLVLDAFGKQSLSGFTLIFVFAMLCRLYAWTCLRRMYEPPRHTSHDVYFSLWEFVRDRSIPGFRRFVWFVAAMSLSVHLSGAVLSVFILRDLGFGYGTYMFVVTTATTANFLFQWIWGKYGDLGGNIRFMRKAAWGIALVPLLWMVSRQPVYLFFVQVFAGAVWGGYTLLMTNYVMEAVPAERRIRALAYINVMNHLPAFIGALIGGWLHYRLPAFQGYSYLTLFLLSCAARVATAHFLGGRLIDVRKKEAYA